MIATFVIAVVVVLGLWTRDLFAHDYGMGGDDLALTTLVAPVPIPEEEPPPEKQPEKKQLDVDVRKELIQNIMSSPVKPPDVVETKKQNFIAMRENIKTIQGASDVTNAGAMVDRNAGAISGNATGIGTGAATAPPSEEAPPPPPTVKPKPPPPKTISGGVLNGKAISLPKPSYPPAARAVRASGSVSVQVLIDENGHVVSASAVSGHPLLQQAAVSAARGARFSPTLLSGQPVKVSGVITYNFVP